MKPANDAVPASESVAIICRNASPRAHEHVHSKHPPHPNVTATLETTAQHCAQRGQRVTAAAHASATIVEPSP
eukprot:5581718-Pleurochrysis_carterae.AAC.3